jgi:hypothetical protein
MSSENWNKECHRGLSTTGIYTIWCHNGYVYYLHESETKPIEELLDNCAFIKPKCSMWSEDLGGCLEVIKIEEKLLKHHHYYDSEEEARLAKKGC